MGLEPFLWFVGAVCVFDILVVGLLCLKPPRKSEDNFEEF